MRFTQRTLVSRKRKKQTTQQFFIIAVFEIGVFFPKRATRLNEKNKRLGVDFNNLYTWGQFHQRSTRSFYVRKFRAQLFCAHVLGLYFTDSRLLAQKQCVECCWNWPLEPILKNKIGRKNRILFVGLHKQPTLFGWFFYLLNCWVFWRAFFAKYHLTARFYILRKFSPFEP